MMNERLNLQKYHVRKSIEIKEVNKRINRNIAMINQTSKNFINPEGLTHEDFTTIQLSLKMLDLDFWKLKTVIIMLFKLL